MVRPTRRPRSGSSGCHPTEAAFGSSSSGSSGAPSATTAAAWLEPLLLEYRNDQGRSLLHDNESSSSLTELALCLTRFRQLQQSNTTTTTTTTSQPNKTTGSSRNWWTVTEPESLYTPLHQAVRDKNLAKILLLLRFAMADVSSLSSPSASPLLENVRTLIPPRLCMRPMQLLTGTDSIMASTTTTTTTRDAEGFTPFQLLEAQQRSELQHIRTQLYRPVIVDASTTTTRRTRSSSFELEDEQDELGELRQYMQQQQNHDAGTPSPSFSDYRGCEVVTYGRSHQTAMEQQQSSSKTFRPQRVWTDHRAVAIAAAAHHTLIATTTGQVYAFGLGKGGRLGIGNENASRPTPTLVQGPLASQRVVALAAAENHSLAVTATGQVYAWGSNRFGQLGITTTTNSESCDKSAARCVPRKVDDLKHVHIVDVAAGHKHSVALTNYGQVHVWGDNSAGQLGISRRNGIHKVQRVEALWSHHHSNNFAPKKAIAIAASDQATLVLTTPNATGSLPVNNMYSWGHGNHVPTKVHFETDPRQRPISPVAIACARYHNVAVTSDGRVYTWGLHSESLGTAGSPNSKSNKSGLNVVIASPQLVTGMLPENGGGIAMGVSASENHTAVITDTGALFTWGATYGKNVMGHAGVRWQPSPKRVPGVCRAVGVVVAKEHTVLLIGTSFPELPPIESAPASLESLAARNIADHVDLFNILPTLIMAERTQSKGLLDFCHEFVRRNLDGVLNVGQKSDMDTYVNEQLQGCLLSRDTERDGRIHPVLRNLLMAGEESRPVFSGDMISGADHWLAACHALADSYEVTALRRQLSLRRTQSLVPYEPRTGRTRSISDANLRSGSNTDGGCSQRCRELTTDMDLSSKELAEAKLMSLSKEIRLVRKRLDQISKLEGSRTVAGRSLSQDEAAKVARRAQLEADALAFEPALRGVERRLAELNLKDPVVDKKECAEGVNIEVEDDGETLERVQYRCTICNITCPDEKSHALHASGRKHRNRVAQAADDDKKQVAANLMQEMQLKQIASTSNPVRPMTPTVKPRTVWSTESPQSPRAPFRLPEPPIPVPDSVVNPKGPVSLREIMEQQKSQKATTPKAAASLSSTPLPNLKVSPVTVPSLKSPPWLKAPVVEVNPRSLQSCSLGDFIPPALTPKPAFKPPSVATTWASPKVLASSPQTTVSFLDIQQQEQDLKTKAKPGPGLNHKWFVERRERAGSFTELQNKDEQERETRLFVEEQYRIEKQIQEDRARENMVASKARCSSRRKKGKRQSGKSCGVSGDE